MGLDQWVARSSHQKLMATPAVAENEIKKVCDFSIVVATCPSMPAARLLFVCVLFVLFLFVFCSFCFCLCFVRFDYVVRSCFVW